MTLPNSDGKGHAEGIAGGIGSGGGGKVWTGASWTAAAGKASNTPGTGSELVVNGGMETGDPPSSWTPSGSTLSAVADERTGGAGSQAVSVINTAGYGYAGQNVSTTVGAWHRVSGWHKSIASKVLHAEFIEAPSTVKAISTSASGTWTNFNATFRSNLSSIGIRLYAYTASIGDESRFDDISIKALVLADLFSSTTHSTPDVLATVAVTLTKGTQAGVVVNLDSAGTPANFVIAYHDGTNCKLEKCVAGTYTTVITAAATYSAGAELRVIKDGTAYRLYYNNALVGTGTIADAGIVSNTLHGLFSTYSANTFDNFTVYARGTAGEYDAPLNEVANG